MAKSPANSNAIETASVLSFERKLDPSDALFSAGDWANRTHSKDWTPIEVREKSVRGTISNRLKTEKIDPAKLDAEIEKPNLQRVDVATLPPTADTLKVRFTLRVLSGTGNPSACNSTPYLNKLLSILSSYSKDVGYGELARRYAHNLANGRFLWRNRVGAEMIEVHVRQIENGEAAKTWVFQALDLSLRHFDAPSQPAVKTDLDALSQVIQQGLAGEKPALLEVIAYARVGDGQEVFPSQELILDKGSSTAGQKSKTLYTVGDTPTQRGPAAMHSQKIGNALRTIDTWYPDEDGLGPIAVEPYGSVTSQGKAYRQPKAGMDFYSLFDAWVLKDQVPQEVQQHYVIANLIRGGVFGKSGKD